MNKPRNSRKPLLSCLTGAFGTAWLKRRFGRSLRSFRFEALEDRTVPAFVASLQAGILTITGDAADDFIILELTTGVPVEIQVTDGFNGTQAGSFDAASVNQILVNAGGGNDFLTIETDSGLVAEVLSYDGEAGVDTLELFGIPPAAVARNTYRATGSSAGSVVVDPNDSSGIANQSTFDGDELRATLSNVEAIVDVIPAAVLDVFLTANAEAARVVDGPDLGIGVVSTQINDGGGGDFASIQFANKPTVTVNGLDGDDSLTVNNPAPAQGLTNLNLFGNDRTGGTFESDDNGADRFFIEATAASVTTFANGNGGNDFFLLSIPMDFSLDLILGPVQIVGGEAGEGAAGDNLQLADSDSTIVDPLVTVTNSTITGLAPAPVTYSEIESLDVIGNDLGNTMDVLSTAAGTTTRVIGGFGSDVITVGNQSADFGTVKDASLDAILGTLILAGFTAGAAGDELNIDDSGDPDSDTITITDLGGVNANTRIAGIAPAFIEYSNGTGLNDDFSFVNVLTGTGSDTIAVTATTARVETTLNSGDGADSVTINSSALVGTNRFFGGTGNDQFFVDLNGNITGTSLIVSGEGPAGDAANRDTLEIREVTDAPRTLTFTLSGNANATTAVSGLGATTAFNTIETVSYAGAASNNDAVTVAGTNAADSLTARPTSTTAANVFLGGTPFANPGVVGGANGPDVQLAGLASLSINGQNPTTSPGDTLFYDGPGTLVGTVPDGSITQPGRITTAFTNIEDIQINTTCTTVVTTAGDAGAGSLREAINCANATAGTDTISFNIPGGGVQTIAVASALPIITDPVMIDGRTQPGFSTTPLILINGASAGASIAGLTLTTGSAGSNVTALAVIGFTSHGIVVDSTGNTLTQNFIGVHPGTLAAAGNSGDGIRLQGGTNTVSNNTIGSNTGAGIAIASSNMNTISGNAIGRDSAGTVTRGNTGAGILLTSANQNLFTGNNVANNAGFGLFLDGLTAGSSSNTITTNQITNNTLGGINIEGGSSTGSIGNTIGGTAAGSANLINNNQGSGIQIDALSTGNGILGNRIVGNSGLGIDLLGTTGPQTNDAGDPDTGGNNLQNFPVLTSAEALAGGMLRVIGTLNSTPGVMFRIEFFDNQAADPTNHGEGDTLIGSTTVTTDGSGNASFNVTLTASLAVGRVVTATASDPTNNTSEFSQGIAVTSTAVCTTVVTNTSDSGTGSLRAAIDCANLATAATTISFQIPASDPNFVDIDATLTGGDANPDVFVIRPITPLPAINNSSTAITIDGRTQGTFGGDSNPNGPEIVLDGVSAGAASGLTLTTNNNTIHTLVVHSWTVDGIRIAGSNNAVRGSYIGVDPTGTLDRGNTGNGVNMTGAATNNTIGGTTADRNIISGNTAAGVQILGSNNNVLANFIGTNRAGSAAIANATGVLVTTAGNNRVGSATAGNVISGNTGAGVSIQSSLNTVQGNLIGTNAAGTAALGNGGVGISLTPASSSSNNIGGAAAGEGNVIASNTGAGIDIGGPTNSIFGNFIGTDRNATINLGNGSFGIRVAGSNTNVGGVNTGQGNVIAFNGAAGVVVESNAQTSPIRGNRIFSNTGLGIDLLGAAGPTANDTGDADTGGNALQNFPVLSGVTLSGTSQVVNGTLNSTASTQFRIEFFRSTAADPSGFGEGEVFLGFVDATTDATGNATFTFNTPTSVAAGVPITATATSSAGNTSEFSAVITAPVPGDVNVISFTANTSALHCLEVVYSITSLTLPSLQLGFFGSANTSFETSDIELDPNLRITVSDASMLTPGTHRLEFDGTDHAQFLTDISIPFYLVRVDSNNAITETNENNNHTNFIGTYLSSLGPSPLVVRGHDSDRPEGGPNDMISFTGGSSVTVNRDGIIVQAPAINISDIRVFVASGNDQVVADDTIVHRMDLRGGTGVDRLIGGANRDFLDGGDGNDTLGGNLGDDRLMGSAGNDRYLFLNSYGADTVIEQTGGGTDTLDFSAVTVALVFQIGEAPVFGNPTDDLMFDPNNVEALIGGSGDDTFSFIGSQTFANSTGTLNGGGGRNTLDYSAAASTPAIVVDLANATASRTGGIFNFQHVIQPNGRVVSEPTSGGGIFGVSASRESPADDADSRNRSRRRSADKSQDSDDDDPTDLGNLDL